MTFSEIYQYFIEGLKATTRLEYIAVFTGIASVWYSRKENILVYPVGLINTIIYIYLSFKQQLFGEASVNFYYTVMSICGWVLWTRKNKHKEKVLYVSASNSKEWIQQICFFLICYIIIFLSLSYLKKDFAPEAIPWADAFASAAAYTGMWLMAKKKVDSWYFWIATNVASIPLYFVKHFVFTSVYYLVLLIMAFWGLAEWRRKAKNKPINI